MFFVPSDDMIYRVSQKSLYIYTAFMRCIPHTELSRFNKQDQTCRSMAWGALLTLVTSVCVKNLFCY